MIIDMPHAVIASVIAGQEFDEELDQVLLFKTDIHCPEYNVEAGLFLLPSKLLLHELLGQFRKIKEN